MTILPKKKPVPAPDADPDSGPDAGSDRGADSGSDRGPGGVVDPVGPGVVPRPRASPPPSLRGWAGLPANASPPPAGPVGAVGSGSVGGSDGPGSFVGLEPEPRGTGPGGGGGTGGPGHSKRRRRGGAGPSATGGNGPGGGGLNVGTGGTGGDEAGGGYNSEDEYEAARVEMDPDTAEQVGGEPEPEPEPEPGTGNREPAGNGHGGGLSPYRAHIEPMGLTLCPPPIEPPTPLSLCYHPPVVPYRGLTLCPPLTAADQVYGDQDMHEVVRKHCMDYLMKNADYFSNYVTEDFTTYINRKRKSTCHGNHIEMQAMAEMYNRPVEVYQYGTGMGLGDPIGGYGLAEQSLMKSAIKTSEESWIEQQMLEDKKRATDWEATNEAIEEQVARESYLQWLRDQEKQARQ
ncbi:OTU domain-containing protein 5, partial [Coturnix japonica]|uniref:OTU domain-containing protein 5 n=1 Tax=Coturnix japonica TaxID=93934 RepID=UPI0007775625